MRDGKPVSPAFLFATLLWHEVLQTWNAAKGRGEKPLPALFDAMDRVLEQQAQRISIPRRFEAAIKEIWSLQPRFEQRAGARPYRLLEHPRFRAAYDFLELRGISGEVPQRAGRLVDEIPGCRATPSARRCCKPDEAPEEAPPLARPRTQAPRRRVCRRRRADAEPADGDTRAATVARWRPSRSSGWAATSRIRAGRSRARVAAHRAHAAHAHRRAVAQLRLRARSACDVAQPDYVNAVVALRTALAPRRAAATAAGDRAAPGTPPHRRDAAQFAADARPRFATIRPPPHARCRS